MRFGIGAPDNSGKTRLGIMIFMLAAVCSGMMAGKYYHDGPRYECPPPERQAYQYSDSETPFAKAVPTVRLHHTIGMEAQAVERAGNPESLQSPALMSILNQVIAWRASFQTPDAEACPVKPRTVWSHAKLIQNPSRWRWSVLHVYGRVQRYYPLEFPELPEGARKLFFVLLRDDFTQDYFTVLTPALPQGLARPSDSDGNVRGNRGADGLIAFDGVFIMDFPYYVPGAARLKDDTPLFFADRVYLACEPRICGDRLDEWDDPAEEGGAPYADITPKHTVPGLDLNFLRTKVFIPTGREEKPEAADGKEESGEKVVKIRNLDLEIAGDLRAEKAAIDHITQYLWQKDPAALARAAQNPDMNYFNMLANPTDYGWMIGQAAGFYGVAMAVEPMRFLDDFSSDDNSLNRYYLLNAGDGRYRGTGRLIWTLCCPNLPRNLRSGDWIAAEGIFCKLYPYKTGDGNWQWSPMLVCKEIRKVDAPSSPLSPSWLPKKYVPWALAVVVVLLASSLVWLYFSGRKDDKELAKLVSRSRRTAADSAKTLGKKKGASVPAAPESPVAPAAPESENNTQLADDGAGQPLRPEEK